MKLSKKRKRVADHPRIEYSMQTRIFDRLFKEDSLVEMKEVVKRKLGLDPSSEILLSQVREGKMVDLEDDDDFDAFYSYAHSNNFATVAVTERNMQENSNEPDSIVPLKKKPTERRSKELFEATSETGPELALDVRSDDPDGDVAIKSTPKPRKKRKINDNNGEHTNSSTSKSIPAVTPEEVVCQETSAELEVLPEISIPCISHKKKKKKKKKKDNTSLLSVRSAEVVPLDQSTRLGSPRVATERMVSPSIQIHDRQLSTDKRNRRDQADDATLVNSAMSESVSPGGQQQHLLKPRDISFPDSIVTESYVGENMDTLVGEKAPRKKSKRTKSHKGRSSRVNLSEIEDLKGLCQPSITGDTSSVIDASDKGTPSLTKELNEVEKLLEAEVNTAFIKTLAARRAELAAATDTLPNSIRPVTKLGHARTVDSRRPPRKVASTLTRRKRSDKPVTPPVNDSTDSTCPLCLLSPLHDREKCPLILGGRESLAERLSELRADGQDDGRNMIVAELQRLLDSAQPSTVVEGTASSADSTTTPLKDADNNSREDIPLGGALGKILSAPFLPENTERLASINLDDIIHGPRLPALRAADIPSPSPDESEEEQREALEEEDEAPRHYRKSTAFNLDSSDGVDSELDDERDSAQPVIDPPAQSGQELKTDVLPCSGLGSVQVTDDGACTNSEPTLIPSSALVPTVLSEDTASLPSTYANPNHLPNVTWKDVSEHPRGDARDKNHDYESCTGEKAFSTPKDTRICSNDQQVDPESAGKGIEASGGGMRSLGTMTPPILPAKLGRQSRLIRASGASLNRYDSKAQSQASNIPSLESGSGVSLNTWATLKGSSPTVDGDVTTMVDELDASDSPHSNHDVASPTQDVHSQDGPVESFPLFMPTQSLPPFPYSQWQEQTQESEQHPVSVVSNEDNFIQLSLTKTKPSRTSKYRRLTDITIDHGLFSTPNELRKVRSSVGNKMETDMYGRRGREEIESESDTETDESDGQEHSHIPKGRRAGTKQK